MDHRPLSQIVGDVADVFERQAIAEGYTENQALNAAGWLNRLAEFMTP